MKKLVNYIYIFLTLCIINNCNKYPNDSFTLFNTLNILPAQIDSTSIKKIYDLSNIDLKDTINKDSIIFNAAQYDNLNLPILYKIQFAKKTDTLFKNSFLVNANSYPTYYKFSLGELNNLSFSIMSIPANTTDTIIARIKSYVSLKKGSTISDTFISYSKYFKMVVKPYFGQAGEKWSVVGTAVPIPIGSVAWSNDVPFIYDQTIKKFKVTLNLTPGDLKFRKDYSWTFSYGSNDGINLDATSGAKNISIGTAGNYTIYFDYGFSTPFVNTFNIVKN